MGPTNIFKAATISQAIAGYFDVVNDASKEVKNLSHRCYKRAFKNLENAQNASSKDNQIDYLETAAYEFFTATTLEQDMNLVSACLGLAMCQFLLDDKEHAKQSLAKTKDIELSKTAREQAIQIDIDDARQLMFMTLVTPLIPHPQLSYIFDKTTTKRNRTKGSCESMMESLLETYKNKALDCIQYIQ